MGAYTAPMNLIPHKMTREQSSEPLHQLLLNFGKGLWQRPATKDASPSYPNIAHELSQPQELALVQNRVRETTIKQMVTTLRMQHEDSEEVVMLLSLESLALAGEISFHDFVGRAQNLFPRALDEMDVPLRLKITSLML